MSWLGYIIPPVILTGLSVAKGVYGDGLPIESSLLWADVITNIAGFEISKLLTEELFDRAISSDFAIEGANHLLEPAIHGLIYALVPHMGLNRVRLKESAALLATRAARIGPSARDTFGMKFMEGAVLNISSNWLSMPITDAI